MYNNIIATAFNNSGEYFISGRTMIEHILTFSDDVVEQIIVFNLGLTEQEISMINDYPKTQVVEFPEVPYDGYTDCMTDEQTSQSRNHVWKCGAVRHAQDYGKNILWIDSGIAPFTNVGKVFEVIKRDGLFFSSDQRWRNDWRTSENYWKGVNMTDEERSKFQVFAAILGWQAGGPYQQVIEDIYKVSQDAETIQNPMMEQGLNEQSLWGLTANRAGYELQVNDVWDNDNDLGRANRGWGLGMPDQMRIYRDRDGSVLMRVWRNDGFYGSRYRPMLTRIMGIGAEKATLFYNKLIEATAPPEYK